MAVVVAAVLRLLAEQPSLQSKDVVQNTIDSPALEPVVRNHAGVVEVTAQGCAERSVDADLTVHLRLLQKLKAEVERKLLGPVGPHVHSAPQTSTLPASVTRA